MRDYTLTPISTGNTWKSWSKQFLMPLANDVKSLYDYWLYFSPNYEEVDFDKLVELNENQLLINALNYRQYVYVKKNTTASIDLKTDINLPEGCIVISNVMPIGNNDASNLERLTINNYIIQYTSSADYYQYELLPWYKTTSNQDKINEYFLQATYIENAGELYGNTLQLQIPTYFSRFYHHQLGSGYQWPKTYTGITVAGYNKRQNGSITFQIADLNNVLIQPYFEVNCKCFLEVENQIDGEEIILDCNSGVFINKIDNQAVPSYNISMNNGNILYEGMKVIFY